MTFQVSYFTGTGCTEYVAQTMANEIEARGHIVKCKNIVRDSSIEEGLDFLIVCFVVHACNAPEPVMNWVKQLNKATSKQRVVIISVSGGGEVSPNLACREPIKRAFQKKKYQLAYEKMIVMPSNWIIETKPILSAQLLKVLPYKAASIINDLENGTKLLNFPLLGNRLFTLLGKLEHIGAHSFAKSLGIDSNCSSCGLCSKNCPASNIIMNTKPIFGNKCILCLNCIYSCPQKALHPTIMKFIVIKQGFSFKDILKLPREDKEIDIAKEAKGIVWLGVKRYLQNTKDMAEPRNKQ